MSFTAMNEKADREGFIAVYPDGTGAGTFLTWNAGGRGKRYDERVNDVRFISAIIDDLGACASIDSKRVYATGISNGGMMCYRLAAELSDRIAAIAPVAGTLTLRELNPARRVPIMHFHGTQDTFVPWGGPANQTPSFITFRSVEDTMKVWAGLNNCESPPVIENLPDTSDDGMTVRKWDYPTRPDGASVVLYEIIGGGHTWPGIESPVGFIGNSTKDISANDLMWEFFRGATLPTP
jgi:polyhydroxybutyrate depolymerase